MSDIDVNLLGDDELYQVFNGLEYKTQRKFLKKVVGNAAQTIVPGLKKEIPKRTTNLVNAGNSNKFHSPGLGRKSIGKKIGRSKKNVVWFVGPKGPKGDYKRDPFYLKWIEFGAYGKNRNLYITRYLKRNLKKVENHFEKSMRIIIQREMKKARK